MVDMRYLSPNMFLYANLYAKKTEAVSLAQARIFVSEIVMLPYRPLMIKSYISPIQTLKHLTALW